MRKVSVIVPVYNSALYMKKCFDSILNSTLEDIEIIAVDDCSQDNSVEILNNYAMRYPNKFKVIFLPENMRQGGARNAGIRAATGEYLAFVDSDDWIEPNMLEWLYAAAKKNNADCAGGDYYISSVEDKPIKVNYSGFSLDDCSKARLDFIHNHDFFWTRIYKTRFIVDNDLYFPDRIFYEDAYFGFFTSLLAKTVSKIDGYFYHYYVREDSTMRSRNTVHQYEKIKIPDLIWQRSLNSGYFEEFENEIKEYFLKFHVQTVIYTCLGQFDVPNIAKLTEISKNILLRMPNYKKSSAYRLLNSEYKFYLNTLLLSPKFLIWCHKHNIYPYLEAIWKKFTFLNGKLCN